MSLMKITYDGEVYECDPDKGGLADAVAFERQFGLPASIMDADDPTPMRAEWAAFMAYRALIRAGVVNKGALPFYNDEEEFISKLELIELVVDEADEDEVADPLESPEAPTSLSPA